jgi:hypothetical protein
LKALLIGLDGKLIQVELPKGGFDGRFTAAVRKLVAAQSIQPLGLTSRLDAWVDENGMTTGRPINALAAELVHSFGSAANLRGPVMLTGADRETGTAASLTGEQITMIKSRLADA